MGGLKNKDGKWHHPNADEIEGIHNKPNVQNEKLGEALDEIFRPENKKPGGTAGELRREVEHGLPKKHLLKAEERITQLKKIIEVENLSRSDRKIAEGVIHDLREAVKKASGGN